jgi:hypothetical protein
MYGATKVYIRLWRSVGFGLGEMFGGRVVVDTPVDEEDDNGDKEDKGEDADYEASGPWASLLVYNGHLDGRNRSKCSRVWYRCACVYLQP